MTRCLIGLELADYRVKYIIVHLDGYFSHIAPILRMYTRAQIETLMNLGFMHQSLVTPDHLPKYVNDTDEPAEVADCIDDLPEYEYQYVYTTEDRWACRSTSYFYMDGLK